MALVRAAKKPCIFGGIGVSIPNKTHARVSAATVVYCCLAGLNWELALSNAGSLLQQVDQLSVASSPCPYAPGLTSRHAACHFRGAGE